MRILFLTQYYPPEMGAPQARISEMAQGLAKRGLDVSIWTSMPNYPTGKVFPGYKGKAYLQETINGVRVHRSCIRPDNSRSFIPRLMSYLSFVLSSMIMCPFAAGKLDVIVVESPPLFLGISGVFIATVRRARIVFNVSDLWPESAVRMGVLTSPLLIHISGWLESWCYKRSWKITGQAPTIVRTIAAKCPKKSVTLITNGVDTSRFGRSLRDDALRSKYGLGPDVIGIVYAGLLGMAQGIEQIIEIATVLRDNSRVKFVLAGDGPVRKDVERLIAERNLRNVQLLGVVDRSAIPQLLASMDIALITLGMSIPGAVPSKIYEAMGSGLPIALIADGDPKEIVESNQAGRAFDFGDTVRVATYISSLAAQPLLRLSIGERGLACVREQFDREAIIDKMYAIVSTGR